METKSFDNVKNQIGYCGLWCGSCAVGNGSLRELTKRYEHIIKGYGVDDWGTKGFDSKEFMKGLAAIKALPLCTGCLKGGGNDACRIRPCALSRKIAGCNECDGRTSCGNLEDLQKVRTGALQVGMIIRQDEEKTHQQWLVEKWTAEIKDKFPNCIINMREE